MHIESYSGRARVLDRDRPIHFGDSTLTIADLHVDEAAAILRFLEGTQEQWPDVGNMARKAIETAAIFGGASVNPKTGEVRPIGPNSPPPPAATTASALADYAKVDAPAPKPSNGSLTVDPAKMATYAAGSPQPAPKPEKVEKAPRKPKAEAPTAEASAPTPAVESKPTEAAPPVPTPAPEAKPTTNGAAASADASKKTGSELGLPESVMSSKARLRDILDYFMKHEGMNWEPGDEESKAAKIKQIVKRCTEVQEHVPALSRIDDLEPRIRRTISVIDAEFSSGDDLS